MVNSRLGEGAPMGVDDELHALMEGAYVAALDEGRWAGWTGRLAELTGARCSAFTVLDRHANRIRAQAINHPNPQALDRYFDEGIDRLDPQVPLVLNLDRPVLYSDRNHVDRSLADAREYFAWIRDNCGLGHYATAATPLGSDGLVAAVSLHWRSSETVIARDALELFAAVAPALRAALKLGFRHSEALTDVYWNGAASVSTEPAMLIDEDGRMLRTNSRLEALFAAADSLALVGRRLCAALPSEDQTLRAMLYRASRPNAARHGVARVSRRSGRTSYIITAFPLPRRARMLAPMEAAALVTVIDPSAAASPPVERYRSALGLTQREAELAGMLMVGHSIESAAAALGIAIGTARVHLRALFAKTRTGRQSELVRLLGRIG